MSAVRSRAIPGPRVLGLALIVGLAIAVGGCSSQSAGDQSTSAATTTDSTSAGPATTSAPAPSSSAQASGSAGPSAPSGASSASGSGGPAVDPSSLVPDAVRQKGTITLAATFGLPPMQVLNAQQQPEGFTIDLANEVGKVLGLKVSFVNTSFNALIPGVLSGRFDGVMGAMTITPERTKQAIMVSYANVANGIMVQAGNPKNITDLASLCGMTVATLIGSTNADALTEVSTQECTGKGKPAIKLDNFADSSSDQAVASGRADAHYDNYLRIKLQAEQEPGKLGMVKDFFKMVGEHGVILAPQSTDLAKAFQAAFTEVIANGAYDAVLKKWDMPEWVKPTASQVDYTPGG